MSLLLDSSQKLAQVSFLGDDLKEEAKDSIPIKLWRFLEVGTAASQELPTEV